MSIETTDIISICNNGDGESYFSSRSIDLDGDDHWRLSKQQSALNFRLRSSSAGYASDWHVAGDPTLLIILSGVIQIELRSGSVRQFKAGEMFVAEDYLEHGSSFKETHGHRAEVIGDESLNALHLKLAKR